MPARITHIIDIKTRKRKFYVIPKTLYKYWFSILCL